MTGPELMPDDIYCALITALNWIYEAEVKETEIPFHVIEATGRTKEKA